MDHSAERIELVCLSVVLGRVLDCKNAILLQEAEPSFLYRSPFRDGLVESYNSLCVSGSGEYVAFNPHQIKTRNIVIFRAGRT